MKLPEVLCLLTVVWRDTNQRFVLGLSGSQITRSNPGGGQPLGAIPSGIYIIYRNAISYNLVYMEI